MGEKHSRTEKVTGGFIHHLANDGKPSFETTISDDEGRRVKAAGWTPEQAEKNASQKWDKKYDD